MRAHLAFAGISFFSMVFSGCGETSDPAGQTCTPETSVSCSCGGGRTGVALCSQTGSPGLCSCENSASADSSIPGGGNGDSGTSNPGDGDGDSPGDGDGDAPGDGDGDAPGDGDGDAPGDGDGDAQQPRGDNCLKGTGADFTKDGPYSVTTRDVTIGSLGPYTLFYPSMLEANCPHPIVAWGNGTGVTGSGVYGHFQRRAASWGIVVVAAHNSNAAQMPYLANGIDYLLAENKRSDSPFYGKLSTRAGVSGHSQGGIAATTAAMHPNVEAEVCVQGGGRVPADVAFLCLTGVQDSVRGPCTSAYNGAAGPAFLADHEDADHVGTPTPLGASTPAGREYNRFYTAWFRCFLADDAEACALFKNGEGSPVCAQSNWANCTGKNL